MPSNHSALSYIQQKLRKWKPKKKISKKRKKQLIRKISVLLQPDSNRRSKKKKPGKRTSPKIVTYLPFMQQQGQPLDIFPEAATDFSMFTETKPMMFDVFRFPIIDWHYRWQRPQQLASKFAEDGYRVFYFSLQTIALQKHDASYIDIATSIEVVPLDDNIWSVTLCSYEPVNAYTTVLTHELDYQYLTWSIQALKEQFNINQTLSIIDLPFWYQLVQHFDPSNNKILYDCMDEHSGFENSSEHLLSLEQVLLEKADMVTVSSELLLRKAKTHNQNVFYIPNACEYTHFSKQPDSLATELENISKPLIGFYGAIANWFDVELINQLAERNPEWTFVLVGHFYKELTEEFQPLQNIVLLGEKPYRDLPKFLYAFDVCLIPFKQMPLTMATNPVKVYEYLCSGKPVVSTKLPELEAMSNCVYLAEGVLEFEKGIRRGLEESGDKSSSSRRDFAAVQTWDVRYVNLTSIINNNLFPKVSIVIPVLNQWNHTENCLKSLLRSPMIQNLEIIIVDNGSTDGTRLALASLQHPSVQVVALSKNKGFAGAVTIGSQLATGDYLVFLNNDTIVPPGWLDRLIYPLMKHEDIGMVGPMSNHVGNDQMLDFFIPGDTEVWNEKWLQDFYDLNKGQLEDTDRLGFFCVAIRKKLFDQIGSLDDGYYVGMFEDDDYCERIINSGHRLVRVEDAFVYHHGNATFNKLSQEQYKMIFDRNKSYFEKKWNKPWKHYPRPINIFHGVTNEDEASEVIRNLGRQCVEVVGRSDWTETSRDWKESVLAISGKNRLVIVYSQSYCNQAVHGFRRIGNLIYLTNRLDWLESIKNSVSNVECWNPNELVISS